jgi:hypothetical protein
VSARKTGETREGWLLRAADLLLEEVLKPAGAKRPEFCVSVGFPKGRHGRGRAVGQCWPVSAARNGIAHIFVSPERDGKEDVVAVLATVLHELIHAVDGCKSGHRGGFAKLALSVGLQKPLTSAANRDATLTAKLTEMAERLGPFPHGALVPVDRPRPGSRLRLWECECGVKVRVASDDFDATCNDCGEVFEQQP